jgi:NAD(P)-dependent dehydrogenase (short-subunit alcohol dehydrogenase family)
MTGVLDRRTILVTGAAGDIGAAAARRFAAEGARIVVTDSRADELAAVATTINGAVLAHACDQSDPDAVAALFAAIRDFGSLDGAFVNAGFGRYGALVEMDFAQWRRHVDVNLNGGFLIATGAARAMIAGGRGGAIVINASTAANHVCDLLGAYAASKAGLAMLSRSLASELGVHRIRVNTVLPGVIETSMTRSLLDDAATRADVLAETPAGRLGAPDDVAALAAFLLSDAAGYITGAEILVDGGQTIHGYPRWFRSDYATPGSPWVAQAKS